MLLILRCKFQGILKFIFLYMYLFDPLACVNQRFNVIEWQTQEWNVLLIYCYSIGTYLPCVNY